MKAIGVNPVETSIGAGPSPGCRNSPIPRAAILPGKLTVSARGEVGKVLSDMLQEKGVTVLAWGENGFREIIKQAAIEAATEQRGISARDASPPT